VKLVSITVLAALVAACATSGTQVNDASLTKFEKGVTTEAEVEHALGRPEVKTKLMDGTQSIAYVYSHAQAKGASFIPVVGLFAGGATGQSNVVTFSFDSQGKLINYVTSSSAIDVHTGLGNSSSTTTTEAR